MIAGAPLVGGAPGVDSRSRAVKIPTCGATRRCRVSTRPSPVVSLAGFGFGSTGHEGRLRRSGGKERAHRASAQVSSSVSTPFVSDSPLGYEVDRLELSRTVRAVILAGGASNTPLTRHRAMPAVPLGTCLKMVDIPINNCMSAGINKIYVLTQFQSQVLNSYITNSYPPLRFGGPDRQSWVDVLAAQQTSTEKEWYQGSADAVRRNVAELMDEARGVTPATDYVILSGAAVYNMDVAALIAAHRDKGADITIAMHAVSRAEAGSKGIAKVDPGSGRVLKFEEKPPPESLDRMRREGPPGREEYLANMGIYVFKRQALFRLLSPSKAAVITHIGHHVVPTALAQDMEVFAHQHQGYWHDVSSLKDFYEANLDLSDPRGPLHMFEVENVVMARGSILPPAHMHGAHVVDSAIGDGAVLSGCVIRRSLVGECVYVGEGSVIERSLLLGSPVWSSDAVRARARAEGGRVYGVGRGCLLRGCIVDENATVGDDVKIVNAGGVREADRAEDEGYMIQDGIVVVMRNSIIPDGKVI